MENVVTRQAHGVCRADGVDNDMWLVEGVRWRFQFCCVELTSGILREGRYSPLCRRFNCADVVDIVASVMGAESALQRATAGRATR
eukprot:5276553-Amphidinium_carterae.2